MKKPNFIIIGSAKCGTTTLAAILKQHSNVCMSNPKEVCFFQDTIDFKINPNFEKGWDWYQQAFMHYNGEKVVGEATPSYSDRTRSPKTVQRIYEFNPKMKLIYMVRNPLWRQISGWKMQYAASKTLNFKSNKWKIEYNWAGKGFEFWMQKQREVGQWELSKFHYQIEAYKEYFPDQQIHVTFLEDWKCHQKKEVNKVLDFLGVDQNLPDVAIFKKENTAERKQDSLHNVKGFLSSLGINKLIPNTIKAYIRSKNTKEIQYPEIDYNSNIIGGFKDYIKEDSKAFLMKYNKSTNFWNI